MIIELEDFVCDPADKSSLTGPNDKSNVTLESLELEFEQFCIRLLRIKYDQKLYDDNLRLKMSVRKGANKRKEEINSADCFKDDEVDETKEHWIETSLRVVEEFNQSMICS